MSPKGAIHTYYSFERSLLWAMFSANFVHPDPNEDQAESLRQEYRLGEKTFKGVLVLEFHTNQPTFAGLTWAVVPKEKGEQWSTSMQTYFDSRLQLNTVWREARRLIGSSAETFPDILYGHELPNIQRAMGPLWNSTMQWRAAFCTPTAEAKLMEKFAQAYFVTFLPDKPATAASAGLGSAGPSGGGNIEGGGDQGEDI